LILRNKSLCAALAITLILSAVGAQSQTINQTKLIASDANSQALFGFTLAATSQVIVAGAPLSNHGAGSAYIFRRSGSNWIQESELVPPAGVTANWGSSVAIDGNIALVGAFDVPIVGVYVNSGSNWVLQSVLTPADGNRSFGAALAISQKVIAVGANFGFGAGSVYIFRHNDSTGAWVQEDNLTVAGTSGFGTSLSLKGDTLAVSAPYSNDQSGGAYIYFHQPTGWVLQATLTPSDVVPFTRYGLGVALSGNTVAVGAPASGPDGSLPGAVFVFVSTNGVWSQQAKLVPPAISSGPGSAFGTGVSIIANSLIVSSAANPFQSGIATDYLLTRSGTAWTFAATMSHSDAFNVPELFPNNVAMADQKTFVFGSPVSSQLGLGNAGAIFVFMQ
jgi:hypothetical protein